MAFFYRSKAMRPSTRVKRTQPGMSFPRNGVCLPWLASFDAVTVQLAAGSKMQMSALAPMSRRPQGSPRIRAGSEVILAMAFPSISSPLPRSRIHFSVSERNSSRPVAPGVASPNGNSFSSSSTGVWSEQMASMVPSSSPCVMASRSACERRGGVRRAFVSK